MKIIFFVVFLLGVHVANAQRFDPNNIDEKNFIAINCVGTSEETIEYSGERKKSVEKYQKYFLIDKESKIVLNYYPKNAEKYVILRGEWKILSDRVSGLIVNNSKTKSLVLNFEYSIRSNSFREVMVVIDGVEKFTQNSEGNCFNIKSLPN